MCVCVCMCVCMCDHIINIYWDNKVIQVFSLYTLHIRTCTCTVYTVHHIYICMYNVPCHFSAIVGGSKGHTLEDSVAAQVQ